MVARRAGIAVSWALIAATAWAQLKQPQPSSMQDLQSLRDKAQGAQVAAPPAPAMESVINPDHYVVGPSDVFSVNVWTDPPLTFRLSVTPEGTLVIPCTGEAPVAGLTLTDARTRILTEEKKRYRFGESSVTLVAPRSVIISVQGRVLNPGFYTLPAYNRVDKALEEANRPLAPQTFDESRYMRSEMSTRRVIVRHADRSESRADLRRFMATQDDRWNPYLREGDVVVVPRNDFTRNVFGVYGEVNTPGRFEYAEGDGVKNVLQIAFGFTPRAIADSVLLLRQDESGEIILRTVVNGARILAGLDPDVPMEPGDRLMVPGHPDLRGDYAVTIRGQVKAPGVYPITRNSTRMTEVIKAAGGFTDEAALASTELIRRSVAEGEIETERLQSVRGGVPDEDSSYYYLETSLRLRKETVYCDFVGLFLRGDTTQNVVLRDGGYHHRSYEHTFDLCLRAGRQPGAYPIQGRTECGLLPPDGGRIDGPGEGFGYPDREGKNTAMAARG
ncbi:MAG: SLBB domain-containing protein [Ignavibacteriae bacterium]|nr:SLBB domain-containing protein [Ignavibacteriota bacterium]